jgi:hypothetical protein
VSDARRRIRVGRPLSGPAVLALAAAISAAAPAPGHAQDWRTVTTERRASGEELLHVDLEYGAGELQLRPIGADVLYRAKLRYDADAFRPVTEYAGNRLRIGVDNERKGLKINKHNAGRLELALGTGVPLDLDLKFGAVQASMDLGGLHIRKAQISTGASETNLEFTRPNPEQLSSLEIEVGAAAFRASGLGNANIQKLDVQGGVADVTLDFSGQWQRDMEADVQMGVGSITFRIPRDVGVRVTKKGFLASFDSDGFTKRDGDYYSTNWSDTSHHLNVDLDSAFGSVNVVWISK